MTSTNTHPLTVTPPSQPPVYEPDIHPSAPPPCYVAAPTPVPIFDPALILPLTNDNMVVQTSFDHNLHTADSPEPPPFSALDPEQLGYPNPEDTTCKDTRTLTIFVAQLAGFLVLIVLAILRYANVFEVPNKGSEYPYQPRDLSTELIATASGMVPGIVLSLGFLFLLLRLQAGTINATFIMPILICLGVGIGSMTFSWETGVIVLVVLIVQARR
ncbi:hypothetical protein BGZ92_008663 [Podila epicladia]|nr:hypothetical protein BGZ92_008663 [Podila epicladia]